MRRDVTVVVMAAGLGTRMRSRQAKVLHRAGGQALVEHVLDATARVAPAERTFVVIGYQADVVRKLLASRGIGFIRQEEQLGTGHAVMCGRTELEPLGGWLLVLNGDGPLIRPDTLERLIERTEAAGAAAMMLTARLDDPTGYGRIVREPDGRVAAIVEQKAATPEQLSIREVNTGQYCFDAGLFWKHAGALRPNPASGEYYLTDMVKHLIDGGHTVNAFPVADASEVLGINNRVELAEVDRIFRDRKARELMLSGVTIEKPETVSIDVAVTVGMDTVIEPFVRLLGRTHIGENCLVGACSILSDAEVADDVAISSFTTIQEGKIGRAAKVGPFSRIRPGSEVGQSAHVGNFVELKNATLGAGAKANHLAYLGDCSIGDRSNIGAGSITCNYDGVRKHRTVIGAEAFIGSNSTLVAPVEVADKAYVGAGSVITDPIPEGALALGRARQVIKEHWVEKRHNTPLDSQKSSS